MASCPRSSKLEGMGFKPLRGTRSASDGEVCSSAKLSATVADNVHQNYKGSCVFDTFEPPKYKYMYRVHMILGRSADVQSASNSDELTPPPVPPRLSNPYAEVTYPKPATTHPVSPTRDNTKSLRSASSPLPLPKRDCELITNSTVAQSRGRKQRHKSTPMFEQWSLQSKLMTGTLVSSTPFATMTLNQFVLRYSHMLPVRVKIVQGYGSMLRPGRVCNIHFVKQTKVQS